MTANAKKVSKMRMAAGVALATIGLSVVGGLAPATANAYPLHPHSGPLHPVRHYITDVTHPLWSITHPVRALIP